MHPNTRSSASSRWVVSSRARSLPGSFALSFPLLVALVACGGKLPQGAAGGDGADPNDPSGSGGAESSSNGGGAQATTPSADPSDTLGAALRSGMGAPSVDAGKDAGSTSGKHDDKHNGPPDAGSGVPTQDAAPAGDGTAEQSCVDDINAYRATLGLPALARWTDAEPCSDGEAQTDSQTGRPHSAFTRCGEMAQNECPGWPGPPASMIGSCLAMMWAEGPGGGHYENMRGNYTKVACGFYVTSSGAVWALQNFR
jgi:hypothetical protein